MPVILETRGLGKSYGRLAAVDSLDLSVERGEIFGLLGPNGAGKTTAISMICGVTTPSRGTAVVDGHDIREAPFSARRSIGYVPQELAVYEELSAVENLRYFGGLYGLGGRALAERVQFALAVAGLTDRAREPVSRFSGGMKRRLNLVAGLLHAPRLLVLDEPTVGVDPQSRNFIFETIRRLRDEEEMTVIYTSHYMEEVEALCRRVAVLDHGALIAQDEVDALVGARGGGVLEIEIDGDAAAVAPSLSDLGEVSVEGGRLRVAPQARLGEIVRAVEACGVDIKSLRTSEPSLESVFLSLTGHALRDDP